MTLIITAYKLGYNPYSKGFFVWVEIDNNQSAHKIVAEWKEIKK